MGIEPMSALPLTPSATCLALTYTHSSTLKTQVKQMSQFSDTNQDTKLKTLSWQSYLIIIRVRSADRHAF